MINNNMTIRKLLLYVLLTALIILGSSERQFGGTIMTNTESESLDCKEAALRASVDLIKGWYSANPEILENIIHSSLAKRGLVLNKKNEKVITHTTKEQFIESARKGGSGLTEKNWSIISATVLDLTDNIATVKVTSTYLIDVCQLAYIDDRWQVVNVLWIPRGTPPWRN